MTRSAHRGPPYDRILFDCDSTLCTIEGLDELARQRGVLDQLKPITDAAMNGDIDFGEAYAERLALLKPDQALIDWLAQQYQDNLTPGAESLIGQLQLAGKQIHIVSGGILQAVMQLAAALGIPITHIHAVSLVMTSDGHYHDYDHDSPLCQQYGKVTLCEQLTGPGENTVFVGDGVTDLETMAAGVDFIGFGGIVRRPAVAAAASVYYEEDNIVNLSTLLLSETERASIDTQPV